MDELTVLDVLKLIEYQAHWCRENGETDMRVILDRTRGIRRMFSEGKSRDEVLAEFSIDEDE